MFNSDVNFRQVEEALKLRPSVFTAKEKTALQMFYGLIGDAPCNTLDIARAIKTTRAVATQRLNKAQEKVLLIFSPTPVPPPAQWISVEDRLPEAHKEVIAFSQKSGPVFACFEGGEFNGEYLEGAVSHWMPKPPPPTASPSTPPPGPRPSLS